MENAVTVRQETTPAMLLNIAIEKGADLEKLEKLMDLQLRWESNQARKAYTEAMTAFKADPPDIEKDKEVKYQTTKGMTQYHHATLANVTDKINSALSAHGLSASWVTNQTDKAITVTCRITHVLGHYEETSLTASPDDSGGKNAIQAIGSTVSYLQRYTILALTGLATKDMDNDGGSQVEHIDDRMKSTILDFINDKGIDTKKFLEYMKVDSIENIPVSEFNKAVASLKAAKGKN